jgi:hypothetical protein
MKTPLTNIDLESHMHVIVLPNQQIDYDTSVVAESFFSYVTTSEKKNGLLLIEVFRKTKLWPPGDDPSGLFLFVRGSKNFTFLPI